MMFVKFVFVEQFTATTPLITPRTWLCSVVVITLDSDSDNLGSTPSTTLLPGCIV